MEIIIKSFTCHLLIWNSSFLDGKKKKTILAFKTNVSQFSTKIICHGILKSFTCHLSIWNSPFLDGKKKNTILAFKTNVSQFSTKTILSWNHKILHIILRHLLIWSSPFPRYRTVNIFNSGY